MPDKPQDKTLLPSLVAQNPAPVGNSQDRIRMVRGQADRILAAFMKVLPSNYVSQVSGPFYTLQFQAAAEQIANIQITAQETLADNFYDYTRPEFLWQILGTLVFPDAQRDGWPAIDGDISYRNFLQQMVLLLLQGAKPSVIKDGIELLTTATVEVIERGIEARKLKGGSAWGPDDQFTFEINISREAGTVSIGGEDIPLSGFPVEDPFVLARNVQLVLRALKPGHTLYDYRHLFQESMGTLFTGSMTFDMQSYYYRDFRRFWYGQKEITGTTGETLVDRTLFSDPTRDFTSISPGAILTILTGPNSTVGSQDGVPKQTPDDYPGNYRVEEVIYVPVGDDATPREYITSPTGLTGTATITGDILEDPLQDWGAAVEGEILTFSTGANAGSYRLKTLVGSEGGPVGNASGPATKVKIAPSILRLHHRMSNVATGQSYKVEVDRLGMQTTRRVEDEDVTIYFTL